MPLGVVTVTSTVPALLLGAGRHCDVRVDNIDGRSAGRVEPEARRRWRW